MNYDDFYYYSSYATADNGATWMPIGNHMYSSVSLPNAYTVFRTYIKLDRILPAGCTVDSVRINYRLGPGSLSGSGYFWFGTVNSGVSVVDSCSVNRSSLSGGVGVSSSSMTLNDNISNYLFMQYVMSTRSSNTFFFCVESITITYSYDGGTGDLFDTNEKLDIQLQLTDNIWENIKIIAEYIVSLPGNIANAIVGFFEDLGIYIVNGFDELLSVLPDDIEESLRVWLDGLESGLSNVSNAISTLQTEINAYITNMRDDIVDNLKTLADSVINLPGTVFGYFEESINNIKSTLSDVYDAVTSIPEDIYNFIIDALEYLFIPSEDSLNLFYDNMTTLFSTRFGALYESIVLVRDYFSTFVDCASTEYIEVEVMEFDLMGYIFSFGGWTVDLVPDGLEYLQETCKFAIDCVCTCLVINTLTDKGRSIFT